MTTTNIKLTYQEDTGLDGKKLYTPKEWTERFRHYTKRIYNVVSTAVGKHFIECAGCTKEVLHDTENLDTIFFVAQAVIIGGSLHCEVETCIGQSGGLDATPLGNVLLKRDMVSNLF